MKKISISIPKPCHENWEAMTPEGKGKFCRYCQKTVIDFSEMSDRQLAEFFKKPAGSVCGRFMPDQLDRVIEIPQKRIPWVRYFFTIALPAFLVSCKFVGRQAVQGEVKKTEQRITGDSVAVAMPEPLLIVGNIMPPQIDSVAKPIQPKNTVIRTIKKCSVQAIQKDSNGFSTPPFEYQPIILKAEAYSTSSVSTNTLGGWLGGVSVSAVRIKKEKPTAPLHKQKNRSPLSSFTVYPNPASPGSIITLDVKSMEQGFYTLSLINSGGAFTQQKRIELKEQNEQVPFDLRRLPSGSYFVRLANEKTGKSYTEIIIVQ